MTSSITVLGSINLDLVVGVDKIVQPGETITGQSFQTFPGGKGSNQALAAHLSGGDVNLIGRVGDDANGRQMLDFYEQVGLPTNHIQTIQAQPTGTALIQVETVIGENSIVVIPGANNSFAPEDITNTKLKNGDIAVSQFEVPQDCILAFFQAAKEARAKTLLNPAPAKTMVDGLLEITDVLVVNETELAFFAQNDIDTASEDDLLKAAQSISGPTTIIVTLGSKGALALHENRLIRIQGKRIQAVDTTGAGDCFMGTLATALARGDTMENAIIYANTAAALSVQTKGAGSSMPSNDDILAAL